MRKVAIMLDTIYKVRQFNSLVLSYPGQHLDIISGRYRVDGKSLMGIFSLDLSKILTVEYEEEHEAKFMELFGKFMVD